jgi:aminotransferase EvaB
MCGKCAIDSNPCAMNEINTIADKYNLAVIADACHAIMATYKGLGMGACSQISCFSMHPLKNLNVWGDGGVIVTNDKAIAERLTSIRNHGLINRDECNEFAYNSRLDTIQAVVAQHLLDNNIRNITDSRIDNAKYLDNALNQIPNVKLPPRDEAKEHVYHLYMGLFESRDELQIFLQSKGIDAKIHYPIPMHLQPAAKNYGHIKGDFPSAEFIADNCLSLPVHEFITTSELDFMIENIQEFYRE